MGGRRPRAVRHGTRDALAGLALDAARARARASSERAAARPSRRARGGVLRARHREGDRSSGRGCLHEWHRRGRASAGRRRGVHEPRDAGPADRRPAAGAAWRRREPGDRPGRAVRRVRPSLHRRSRSGGRARRADLARPGPASHACVDGVAARPRAPEPALPGAVGGGSRGPAGVGAVRDGAHVVRGRRARGARGPRARARLHDGRVDPRGLDAGIAADAARARGPGWMAAPGRTHVEPPRSGGALRRSVPARRCEVLQRTRTRGRAAVRRGTDVSGRARARAPSGKARDRRPGPPRRRSPSQGRLDPPCRAGGVRARAALRIRARGGERMAPSMARGRRGGAHGGGPCRRRVDGAVRGPDRARRRGVRARRRCARRGLEHAGARPRCPHASARAPSGPREPRGERDRRVRLDRARRLVRGCRRRPRSAATSRCCTTSAR